jgi:hypothetical protein
MSTSVVLVDRDPLYAWFVTEALLQADTAVTWFRDAASAVASAPEMPAAALLLVDGVTWLTAERGAAAADDTWRRAILIGWDPRTPAPAGFVAVGDKPGDAGDLRALVAGALSAAPAARAPGLFADGAG